MLAINMLNMYPIVLSIGYIRGLKFKLSDCRVIQRERVFSTTVTVNVNIATVVNYCQVTDSAGSSLAISRDYKMAARELVPPGGQRCKLTMDSMGQLASFVTTDNVTMHFSYVGNSGLIESKENSAGQTFVYEYDDYGRISAVVQPTGERIIVIAADHSAGLQRTPFTGDAVYSSSQILRVEEFFVKRTAEFYKPLEYLLFYTLELSYFYQVNTVCVAQRTRRWGMHPPIPPLHPPLYVCSELNLSNN